MADEPEIDKSPAAIALVQDIYTLEAELAETDLALKAKKLDLILLKAPKDLADKLRLETELKPEELVKLAAAVAGKYADAQNRVISVVVPTKGSSSFDLYPPAEYKKWLEEKGLKKGSPKLEREFNKEREEKARELAGDQFGTLFDYLATYTPAANFDEFVERLRVGKQLTDAKARDILALCELKKAPASPHVKVEKPKKEK